MLVTGRQPTMVEKIASGIGSVATLAKAVAPVIAAINTEHKYVDTAAVVGVYNPGTSDSISILSQVTQGTDDSQRIGNSILMKDIAIRFSVAFLATTSVYINTYRLTLLVWKENVQSNNPTIAKIFESPTNLLSAFNKDYTDQMVIIKDKMFSQNPGFVPTGSISTAIQTFKWYRKLDFHARWLNATTGQTQNHIYLVMRGVNPLVDNATTVSFYSRINYTDN